MMLAASFILVALSSVGAFDANRVHYDVARCLSTETECGKGCCPYSNATCCSETQTCCRADSVCLGQSKLCLGLKFKGDGSSPSLYTEKSAHVINENDCPAGQTPCYDATPSFCCPMPDAVCCKPVPDAELACCPHNTICDDTGMGCLANVSKRFTINGGSVEVLSNSILKPARRGNVEKSRTVARCLATETECGRGCCPYTNATCCSETQTCCRADSVCLGQSKLCLGLKSKAGGSSSSSLYTEKSARVMNEFDCFPGQTLCYTAEEFCCPMPDAVCCKPVPDAELACCPHNTTCDDTGLKCLGTVSKRFVINGGSVEDSPNSILKPVHRRGNVEKSRTGQSCCFTLAGYKCCPESAVCIFLFGCWPI